MKKRVPDKFWFPWWPDKWIFGSMRIECTVEERAIWVDLLSLASKDNGFIRANEEIPYPLEQLAGMLRIPEELFIRTIEKFINLKDKSGKGKLTKMKDGTLYVTTWEEYQFSRTAKFYAEKGRSEQKGSHSEQESKEYIILDNSISNNNKVEDTGCDHILNLLSKAKDYSFSEERDRKFIGALITEFPDLDALEEIKKKCAWWLSNPLLKKSNPHLQIRNWFINARKYLKEGDQSRKVGASTHAPSKKEDDYSKARTIKVKELEEKYQSEYNKAMKAKSSDWMDEIDNKIKEGIAEFSRKYHEERK